MDDLERAFRDALHRVDTMTIPVPPVDAAELTRRPGRPTGHRWLAAAAAVVVVAGLAVWALAGRNGSVPAVPAATPSVASTKALVGGTWAATELGGQVAVPTGDKVPYVRFAADGSFTGGDPCNGIMGTYRFDGEEIRIAPGGGFRTLMGCDTGQQKRFTSALTGAHRAELAGDTLRLLDASADTLAVFRWTETPAPSATPSATVARVRIDNVGTVDFDDVILHFPDGTTVHYGPVLAGASSFAAYSDGPLYRYAAVEVMVNGTRYRFQPDDFLGETALPPGTYTYELDLVGDSVRLVFRKGG
ncbi:MAG: META domain-containing protein [Actinobacteria bacterium]|nr:META domain-containing protein [Actinomycetota bacterium]